MSIFLHFFSPPLLKSLTLLLCYTEHNKIQEMLHITLKQSLVYHFTFNQPQSPATSKAQL